MSAITLDPKLLERVNDAIADIRAGKMVILVDDEDRENEGDLCMAAEFVTAVLLLHGHARPRFDSASRSPRSR